MDRSYDEAMTRLLSDDGKMELNIKDENTGNEKSENIIRGSPTIFRI